jgi:hemolysin activation/secretion protein
MSPIRGCDGARTNLTVRGTFSAVTTSSDLDGLLFNQDRVRSARLGLTYDFVDGARGANVIDLEASHGLNAFGANPTGTLSSSNPNGRSDYTKFNLYTARLQPIIPRVSVLAALQAQYTDQPLLVPEQFALGGEQFLRAYDAAELLGDRGYGLKVELRYSLTASGSATAYGFYDYGRVYSNASGTSSQDAASAGMGLRFILWRRLNAYIEGAVPIGRDVSALNNRNPRAFGGLQLEF